MYILDFKNYHYIIKIKNRLDIVSLAFSNLIDFFTKKANCINACFRHLLLKPIWRKT